MFTNKKLLIVAIASGFSVALSSQHYHDNPIVRKMSNTKAVIDANSLHTSSDRVQVQSIDQRTSQALMRKVDTSDGSKGGTEASITETAHKSHSLDNTTSKHLTTGCTEIALCSGCAYSAKRLMRCSGSSISSTASANTCPSGWKLISPRSKADWITVYSSTTSPASPYFVIDVTKPAGGNDGNDNAGMSSSRGLNWRTSDGSDWWLRDSAYGEPNGDYTANCYLSVGWPAAGATSSEIATFVDGIGYNDHNCNYAASEYLCQPEQNSANYVKCALEEWSEWTQCSCATRGEGHKGTRTKTRVETTHPVGAYCTCGSDGKGPVDDATWDNYANNENCILAETDNDCSCHQQTCADFINNVGCDADLGTTAANHGETWVAKESPDTISCKWNTNSSCMDYSADNILHCCLVQCDSTADPPVGPPCKCGVGEGSDCDAGTCDSVAGTCTPPTTTLFGVLDSGAMRTAGDNLNMAVASAALMMSVSCLFL